MRQKAAGRLRGMRHLAVGAVGAAYGVGRLLRRGMEREEQQLYLRTVINAEDGDKDAAVGRAVAGAREQARRSLATETEILDVEYALNSAGLGERAARAGTEVVHRLAKVTRGESGLVGEVVGGVYKNMGKALAGTDAEKLSRIADVLGKAQFKFAFRDFGQLGESFKEAAPGALGARLAFEDVTAAVGVLNNAQLTGGRAGTALNAVLRNLSKAARELGTEVVRDAEGGLDLVATLGQIKDKADAMGAQERQDTLQKLFGDEGQKGIMPLLENLGDLSDGMDALGGAVGTVDNAYETFLQSTSGKWTMFTNRMRIAGDTLAQHVLPAITDVVGKMADMASAVGGAIEQWPWLGRAVVWFGVSLVGVTAAVAAWNGVAWIGGGVMSMWGARTKAAEAAGKLWTATTKAATAAALRWNAAAAWTAARLPFLRAGLVGAAGGFRVFGVSVGVGTAALRVFRVAMVATGVGAIIVSLGAGAAWIMRNWEPVKAFFAGVARGIGAALGPIVDALGPVGDALRAVVGFVVELFTPLDASKDALEEWGEAGAAAGRIIGETIEALVAPLFVVGNLVGATWAAVTGDFETAKRRFGQSWDWVKRGVFADAQEDAPPPQAGEAAGKARAGKTAAAAAAVAVGAAAAGAPIGPVHPDMLPAAGYTPVAVPQPVATPAIATPNPVGQPSSGSTTVTVHVGDIVIHPPPGADAAEIARIVHRELAAALRRGAVEAGLSESD